MEVDIRYDITLHSDASEDPEQLVKSLRQAAVYLEAAAKCLTEDSDAGAGIAVLLLRQMKSTVTDYANNIAASPSGFSLEEDRTCGPVN
jgi:hypothetical protein